MQSLHERQHRHLQHVVQAERRKLERSRLFLFLGMHPAHLHTTVRWRKRFSSNPELGSLRLGFQPGNQAVTTPKFNRETVDEKFRLLDCFGIASANQWGLADDMSAMPYKVRPVLFHP
jgi:hypothetical protein